MRRDRAIVGFSQRAFALVPEERSGGDKPRRSLADRLINVPGSRLGMNANRAARVNKREPRARLPDGRGSVNAQTEPDRKGGDTFTVHKFRPYDAQFPSLPPGEVRSE